MTVDEGALRTASEQGGPALSGGKRTHARAHVVLPAYNEAASLPPLLHRLAEVALTEQLTAWVVDDGSSDGTAEVAIAGVPGLDVRLVSHPVNLGLGQAVQSGLRAVLAEAGEDDVVVVMDADDTHDPDLIRQLESEIAAGADVVICSRFVAGGDDATAPALRRLLSRGAAVLFRQVLRVDGVRDFTSGFRAYRVSLLTRAAEHWGERLIEERGFACMVELLLKLRHCRPVVAEVPLTLRYDRKQGPSKIRIARTVGQYVKLLVRDRLSPAPYRAL
ncbi:glycosyltransferase [Saccharothrix sp. NRRL B-16314]|uniref:glycosyltransferase n=1 Tax=Saccharothrix sp. NRRL B-16314 TaxID=1463825 RepID=UPI0005245222|nr:glycosyltransferase [Saccharothrix sp. NRRL B-16314]